MSNTNRTYRIRTNINKDAVVNVNIDSDYDVLEILSLKVSTENMYKRHTSKYGCVVGRVLANESVGIPNAKVTMFIEADEETLSDNILHDLYPYRDVYGSNSEGIRFNLLPDEQISSCHQPIGTFPNKRLVLDDNNVLEIFDKYYKFTTVSNNAGDYMIMGVPVGEQKIHVDIDLSDIGILSQKPIDLMYKGYNVTQFENPGQFKKSTNLDSLSQVISENTMVNVLPFWGDENESQISLTRHDVNVNYKFEPTCIFMGSIVTDEKSNGFSKKCIPGFDMGRMNTLVSGNGTIEMIRKRADGTVEEFSIQGNELINGNGVWCYQIPMNLDYVTTDEYGNLVPTDNPEKGIPTRTSVRFRVSLSDFDSDYQNNHLVKLLVPNNPEKYEDLDYVFGTNTKEDSYRDLFWNNVYTVKSYIPRIQKGNTQRTNKFSGFKAVNVHNTNNPIPYNNMRVNITFMFTLQCAIIKCLIFMCKIYNWMMDSMPGFGLWKKHTRRCLYIGDALCPDLEGWYFAPGCNRDAQRRRTLAQILEKDGYDTESTDVKNSDDDTVCLTNDIKYFNQCVEINLAMENDVIQFDFYNDWINGLLYIPRWFVNIRKKRSYLFGLIKTKPKIQACMDETFHNARRLTQQCALTYTTSKPNVYNKTVTALGCKNNDKQKCHKTKGRKYKQIFKGKGGGGIVHKHEAFEGISVYYPKPAEWLDSDEIKCNLFATDIVLLGNINSCNMWGIPSEMDGIESSTYQMPPKLVQTNMNNDSILLGLSNGSSLCNNKATTESISELPQTFQSYVEWSKNKEFFESNPDDMDEYAVTEIAGIDWGVSGPNQGKNSPKELYYPGGHFLGIGCSNAAVNIKSCVNLSRICELGVLMSQRQYGIVKNIKQVDGVDEISYKYEFIIPSGLISKGEISDNNFRNIFATLNYNRLRTKVNEKGFKTYDFISVTPINFNGELQEKISANKYNTLETINDDESGFNRDYDARRITIEENSEDYYYFRLGVTDRDSDTKKKFLNRSGNNVSMPVYENSFYFYFGLKDGATALDKFRSEYYAPCPNNNISDVPSITIETKNAVACNQTTGSAVVIPYNVPIPYEYFLFDEENKQIRNGRKLDTSEISLTNLLEGTYSVTLKNENMGISLSEFFTINTALPPSSIDENGNTYNVYDGCYEVSQEDFINMPKITIKNNVFNSYILENGGIIKIKVPYYGNSQIVSEIDENIKPPYPLAIVVKGENYSTYKIITDGVDDTMKDEINNYILSVLNIKEEEILTNTNSIWTQNNDNQEKYETNVLAWGVNETFEIYLLSTCIKLEKDNIILPPDDGIIKPLSDENNYINAKKGGIELIEKFNIMKLGECYLTCLNHPLDFYIYDETLSVSELHNYGVLADKSNFGDGNVTEATIDIDALSSLTPLDEWKIKRALSFTKSAYDINNTGAIRAGLMGGTPPYSEKIRGNGEYVSDKIYVGEYFRDKNDAEKKGYSLEINSFNSPTEPWIEGSLISDLKYNENILFNEDEKENYILKGYDNNNCVPYLNIDIMKAATDTFNENISLFFNIENKSDIINTNDDLNKPSTTFNDILAKSLFFNISYFKEDGSQIIENAKYTPPTVSIGARESRTDIYKGESLPSIFTLSLTGMDFELYEPIRVRVTLSNGSEKEYTSKVIDNGILNKKYSVANIETEAGCDIKVTCKIKKVSISL